MCPASWTMQAWILGGSGLLRFFSASLLSLKDIERLVQDFAFHDFSFKMIQHGLYFIQCIQQCPCRCPCWEIIAPLLHDLQMTCPRHARHKTLALALDLGYWLLPRRRKEWKWGRIRSKKTSFHTTGNFLDITIRIQNRKIPLQVVLKRCTLSKAWALWKRAWPTRIYWVAPVGFQNFTKIGRVGSIILGTQ